MTVPKLVVIGASLGGVEALDAVLSGLSPDFSAAIAIVQHRGEGHGLVERLSRRSPLPVCEPDDGTAIEAGRVYLAPAGYHLLVGAATFSLSVDERVRHARPSIDVLFDSASHAHRSGVVGVLLTAASSDGAEGMAAIVDRGGLAIVQDPATARSPIAVLAALDRAAVDFVLPLEKIAPTLEYLVGRHAEPTRARRRVETTGTRFERLPGAAWPPSAKERWQGTHLEPVPPGGAFSPGHTAPETRRPHTTEKRY